LHCAGRSHPVWYVVPDRKHPKVWRICRPDRSLSGMANLKWARDDVVTVALRILIARPEEATLGATESNAARAST